MSPLSPLRCKGAAAYFFVFFVVLGAGARASELQSGDPKRPEIVFSEEAQRNERFLVVTARRGRVFRQIDAMARVDADVSRVIDIHSAGSGKVTDVAVIPGQPVKRGQTLISYTDHSLHEMQLQRKQAEAALASARAGEAEAALLYRRGRSLEGTVVARGEVDRRRMVLQQQHDLVKAKEADLGTLEHRRTEEFISVTEKIVRDEASDLISPVDGLVQSIRTSIAADIRAGDHLVTVVDLSRLWLVAELSPGDATQLKPGGSAVFRFAGQEDSIPVEARVATIAGLADPSTGLVRVVCVLDHPSHALRPGMMLDASFETGDGAEGVVVPRASLQEIDGGAWVFLRHDKTHFSPIKVKILQQNEVNAVISGAINEGDEIVGQGSFALKSKLVLSTMSRD